MYNNWKYSLINQHIFQMLVHFSTSDYLPETGFSENVHKIIRFPRKPK